MQISSRPVTSNQPGPHPRLAELVARHASSEFKKPITDYNRAAFEHSLAGWDGRTPLILDAACGVGESTLHLAQQFPDHFVIGVDQSADRLARDKSALTEALPANLAFVRADLIDYWRLWDEARLPLARHFLLYPNPWPKAEHVQRRWHGHAVFPTLLALGGRIECRSNWQTYVDELALALTQLGRETVTAERWEPDSYLTPFERKYHQSGQALWRCVLQRPIR